MQQCFAKRDREFITDLKSKFKPSYEYYERYANSEFVELMRFNYEKGNDEYIISAYFIDDNVR